ncbi:hypothetical protein D3C85_1529050 [compost metagenome]
MVVSAAFVVAGAVVAAAVLVSLSFVLEQPVATIASAILAVSKLVNFFFIVMNNPLSFGLC